MPQNNFPWTGAEAPTWNDIADKPATFPSTWNDIADKPATFPSTAATNTAVGGVFEGVHIPALTAAPTEADFNNLLTVLQNAGVLASS